MKHRFAAPPCLKPGDRVRIIAPSGPVDREQFEKGIQCLEEFALQAVYENTIFSRHAYLAGDDQRRHAELDAAFNDQDASAIWFARGGYGATRLLTNFETTRVHSHPCWLVGFSDATALHAQLQRAGLQSLHAGNITGLPRWTETAKNALGEFLFNRKLPELCGTTVSDGDIVTGPVVGGNLTVFSAMAGTGFLPDIAGCIVFFEDVGERPYRLDRSLTQLRQAGVFNQVQGFVIGQLTNCIDPPEQDHGCNALTAVCSVLQQLDVPIIANIPVGHERSSLPLPLGAEAQLNPAAGTLTFAV